jgi:PAS domain S-box-containing protein
MSRLAAAEPLYPRGDELWQRLVELSGIAFYSYKLDGTILYIDKAAVRILDLSDRYPDPAVLAGSNLGDLLDYVWPSGRLRETIREKHHVHHLEYPFKTLSGKTRWTLHDSHLTRDPDTGEEVICAIVRDITSEKTAQLRLARSHERMQNLARRLQDVREEERLMVAREIHDQLGQLLVGLDMEISALSKRRERSGEDLVEELNAFCGTLTQALVCVRQIVSGLRPPGLDDLGLVAAIEWETDEFRKRTGIEVVFDYPEDGIAVLQGRDTTLFRILQEALTNVARHSGASRVWVAIAREDGQLSLTVRDNGCGVDPEHMESSRSYGLIGMRERALAWQGEVRVESSPGMGATVTASLPVGGRGE